MKATLKWLNEALAAKETGGAGMTYYRVQKGMISATDGRLTASHPWEFGEDEFLVPGAEFEKVLNRMPGEPELSVDKDGAIKLKSGKFSGTIQTLPLKEWQHAGVDGAKWQALPKELIVLLAALRPFLNENTTQQWAQCVALDAGWMYATNNIAIAGAPCKGLEKIKALLPMWAVDFVLGRTEDVVQWAWTEHYVAFRWENGAWVRSQLIVGQFPEKAATLVRQAHKEKPTYIISDEFREAFGRVADLAEDTILVFANSIQSRFGKAIVEEGIKCKVPKGEKASVWGAKFLVPALQAATSWSPEVWPQPAPWKGEKIAGYVVGRRA